MSGYVEIEEDVPFGRPYPGLRRVLSGLTYKPGWSWHYSEAALRIDFNAKNSRVADPVRVVDGGLYVESLRVGMSFLIPRWVGEPPSPSRHPDAILFWVRSCFAIAELHELDEFFVVDGKRVFDPHDDGASHRVNSANDHLVAEGLRRR